jgi:hypothetical protein
VDPLRARKAHQSNDLNPGSDLIGAGGLWGTTGAAVGFLRMQIKSSLLLSCVLLASAGAVSAQAPPAPTTPPAQTAAPPSPDRANGCTPTQTTPQGNVTPGGGVTTGQSGEPLGDKLAKSDGVLCPPSGVDPAMRAPTPNEGNTPVIPPPGSPGGNPNVRPK